MMNIDKENLVRALGDKSLFARNQWQCAFGIHTWLPWKDPVTTRRVSWQYLEQYRHCGCCNKAQRRVLAKN